MYKKIQNWLHKSYDNTHIEQFDDQDQHGRPAHKVFIYKWEQYLNVLKKKGISLHTKLQSVDFKIVCNKQASHRIKFEIHLQNGKAILWNYKGHKNSQLCELFSTQGTASASCGPGGWAAKQSVSTISVLNNPSPEHIPGTVCSTNLSELQSLIYSGCLITTKGNIHGTLEIVRR